MIDAMTTLLLIRHGQTDWNAQRRWQGHTDIPLNATGLAQAQAVARRLADWPLRAVYSSDLQRAAQTAAAVAAPHGLAPVADARWRERSAGRFEGLTGADLARDFPDYFQEMQRGIIRPLGGEMPEALLARVAEVFEQTVAQHNGDIIAVVSHGGTIRMLLAHVLGLPPTGAFRLGVGGNTGLSRIEIDGRGPRLTLLNDTSHLDRAAPETGMTATGRVDSRNS